MKVFERGLYGWLPEPPVVRLDNAEWSREYMGEWNPLDKTENDMGRTYTEHIERRIPEKITSHPPSQAYRDNWDATFAEPEPVEDVNAIEEAPLPKCKACPAPLTADNVAHGYTTCDACAANILPIG